MAGHVARTGPTRRQTRRPPPAGAPYVAGATASAAVNAVDPHLGDQVRAAFTHLEQRHPLGKIVLLP